MDPNVEEEPVNETVFGDVELAVQSFTFHAGRRWVLDEVCRELNSAFMVSDEEVKKATLDLENLESTAADQEEIAAQRAQLQDKKAKCDLLREERESRNQEMVATVYDLEKSIPDCKRLISQLIRRKVKKSSNPFFDEHRRSLKGVHSFYAVYFMKLWFPRWFEENKNWTCNRNLKANEYMEILKLATVMGLHLRFRGQLPTAAVEAAGEQGGEVEGAAAAAEGGGEEEAAAAEGEQTENRA